MHFSIKRLRRHFGAPCKFQNKNSGDHKMGWVECTPYDDKNFDLKRIELNTATQVTIVL